jgi:hypothetical protein
MRPKREKVLKIVAVTDLAFYPTVEIVVKIATEMVMSSTF